MTDARTQALLLSHPTFNSNVRNLGSALAETGGLSAVHTSIETTRLAERLRPVPRLADRVGRRRSGITSTVRIHSHPAYEVAMRLSQRLAPSGVFGHALDVHGLYRYIDRLAAHAVDESLSGVVAYEDGARATFQRAEELGLARIYDLPIPHFAAKHRLLLEEAAANPEWAEYLGGVEDPPLVLDTKVEELSQASIVLTASDLSTKSVREVSEVPVCQIPYGCPTPVDDPRFSSAGPLRVLFVGSLTQRKGISYLFEACRNLERSVELTVVGRPASPIQGVLATALDHHRHITSLPHGEILALMRQHDVLLLPSIVEGFGLVIGEALAQGVPVVTTTRTGGPALFGAAAPEWIVPPGSASAIETVLAHFARDRDSLNDAKLTALAVARSNPWSHYRALAAAAIAAC